jgi:uncharacterized membrane protein
VPAYSKLLYLSGLAFLATLPLAPFAPALLAVTSAVLLYQLVEVGVALRIMRAERRVLVSLAFAPVFLAWKALIDSLALVGYRRQVWARTERQPHTDASPAPAYSEATPVGDPPRSGP